MRRPSVLSLVLPVALAVALAAGVAACGGSGSGSDGTGAVAPTEAAATEAAATPDAASTDVPAATASPATPAPTEAAALIPGAIGYRIVNGTGAPVDVHVRSQGLVQAEAGALGLAPGAVSDALFPPDPGAVVVLPAGEGDPTCVTDCAFLAESSTTFGEGDLRVLVVRDGGSATEFWANPNASSVGAMANALAPADPATGLAIIDAGGMADASFGLNVGIDGVEGCVGDAAGSGMLLGGTSVLAYPVPAQGGALSVYPASDTACTGPVAGGPFTLGPVAPGARTFLVLWGASGAAQGAAIPLQ